ncbi:hypothetical protein VTN77DRAFT_8141 [Rasamsonia byssochlamydoides]|uniref:uncharacterized protein n=1 Tax=Rasamsonia byssochlamydoides TaxID=89139 RepID=UPI003742E576
MTKGCYTCRRRRIVCDNGLPTCRKCRDAGKECLGYQKPLVWVKGGVASRGKMMGLSFDDVMDHNTSNRGTKKRPSVKGSSGPEQRPEPSESFSQSTNQNNNDNNNAFWTDLDGSWNDSQPWPGNYNGDGTLMHVQAIPSGFYDPSPSWALVDPLFQDISRLSRFYIWHFNQRCCPDLALYDTVKNPYRDLIPFIHESPVLTDALAAVGAIHYAYMSSSDLPLPLAIASSDATTFETFLSDQNGTAVSISRRVSSKAYEHYLGLKQRALRQLSIDISDPLRRNDDRTVAAIFVLILLDAIESGSGAWKYHLEGAKNLLKSRQAFSNGSMRGMIEGLNTFVIDSCLITEIMGSTLARPGVLSKPFYSQAMGPAILKRLEKTSWVGCPAYLLEVMFFVHAQRYSDSDLTAEYSLSFLSPSETSGRPESPVAILQHIDAFDPVAWAEEMQTFLFLPDLSKRVALASAYKAAVYLYAKRVLSKVNPLSSCGDASAGRIRDHDTVESELIDHLSLIPPDDEHFKCTIWLTFIAGAESKYPEQRAFALERLSALWSAVISVNVQNAAWVLKLMWQRQDEKRQEWARRRDGGTVSVSASPEEEEEEFDWIQELDRSRTDWLFI